MPTNESALIILCLLLMVAIIVIVIGSQRDLRRMQKQNDDLLNRLMSADFQSYAAGKVVLERGAKWKDKQPAKDQDDSPKADGVGLSVT